MRIDKKSDSRLFELYENSKAYRKMTLAEKRVNADWFIRNSSQEPNEIAKLHCEWNGIAVTDDEEAKEHLRRYTIRFYDMQFLDFAVEFISDTFYQAARENAVRLLNSTCDNGIYELLGTCSGIIVFSDYLVRYAIREDGTTVVAQYRASQMGGGQVLRVFGKCGLEKDEKIDSESELGKALYFALAILILKKYGEVETQIIAGNTRRKSLNSNEIIMNSAPFKITQVDSMWLRTIIRTEGFLVRGHFRLQACGENYQDRKLIYIYPFQKHGYVRRAGKLVAEERAFTAA